MSTDFNIKPVGAPVAAPIAPPVSEAAQSAVATSLPVNQSVTAADASVRVTIDPTTLNASRKDQAFFDRDAASIVYQVVDNRTSQIVDQFPDQAVLRRRVLVPPTAALETGKRRNQLDCVA